MEKLAKSSFYCGVERGISQEGWLGVKNTSLDTTETSATEKIDWIARKLQAIHSCGSKVILTVRDKCLSKVAVPIRCHSPVCPTCARIEQEETLRRYKPIFEQAERSSKRVLFITLTTWKRPSDGDELRAVLKEMSGAYRKLLDMRLGARKRKWLREQFYEALRVSNVRNKSLQAYLFEEFLDYCERNGVQKFRDLIKVGVRRPEITYDASKGWFNPHFHIIWFTDCPIPQVLLSFLWTTLTGTGIVDVREAYESFDKELIKYMTKFWEIPEDKIGEVVWALRGLKKVMLHGVKLIKTPKSCPHCGHEDCKAHPVAIAKLDRGIDYRYKHGDTWLGEIVSIRAHYLASLYAIEFGDSYIRVVYAEGEGFVWFGDWKLINLDISYKESVWFPYSLYAELIKEREEKLRSKGADPPLDSEDCYFDLDF